MFVGVGAGCDTNVRAALQDPALWRFLERERAS
jgi:hypothetical protein